MKQGKGHKETPTHAEIVQRLVESGLSFALFRLPDTADPQLFLMTEGEAKPIIPETEEPQGFIFAPFSETTHRPTLLFEPQVEARGWKEITSVCSKLEPGRCQLCKLDAGKHDIYQIDNQFYRDAFNRYVKAIANDRFEKLVLARCVEMHYHNVKGREGEVFVRAEKEYPHCMVSLVYSPISGRWLGATPELLLSGKGADWETMALAGTHVWGDGEWDLKNVQEQDVVARYMGQTLKGMGATYECTSPYTSMAGKLMHRRTDFTFHLGKSLSTMQLLRTLHPTPAVCGMPKMEAKRFIETQEHQKRNYFSGYLGPVNCGEKTQVYVNLRCVNIRPKGTLYYAGGGISILSRYMEEKLELERKMRTIKDLLDKHV